eukprot:GHVS01017622.1.p1 GENE.GHVS01017622.1~~GHVS01017622.1.p1  ORF type:complete len:300 (+),score=65.42 GHVS01017622.1:421-1320(+)
MIGKKRTRLLLLPPPCRYIDALEQNRGESFNFDNHRRNIVLLASKGLSGLPPPARKTGTTICGVVCKDAVVLAADTRATEGSIVADKECLKLHRISDNIFCAGAGTSADLEHTTGWLESKIELHRLNTGTQPRVSTAVTVLSQELFKYQGYKGCAVVMGGVDTTGPSLYKVHPHGSTDRSPFASMGSGSLNALAVLENGYADNMSIDDGKALASSAIAAGVANDLGSGGNVDLCVINHKGVAEVLRGYSSPNTRPFRLPMPIMFNTGTTAFFREKVELIRPHIVVTEGAVSDDVEMGTS